METKPKILVIGGGFGGIYSLKNLYKFLKRRGLQASLEMVADKNYFLFTPLLHEVATGGLNPSTIIEPIREILGYKLNRFYLGRATNIDFHARLVTAGENKISYDYLIIAPGSTTNFYDTPGAEAYSLTLKDIPDAIRIKNHCIRQVEKASLLRKKEDIEKALRFVIIGGGPTGVELAAEIEEFICESFIKYYDCDILKHVSIHLIQKNEELLPQLNQQIRKKAFKVLQQKNIQIYLNSEVKEIGENFVQIKNGEKIEAETIIWTAGITPNNINFSQPISLSLNGKIEVNRFLQTKEFPEVFVLGDASNFFAKNTKTPLPALAQVATKESVAIAKNICRIIAGQPLKEFSYHDSGTLLSLGQWMAAGEIFNFTVSGKITWWLWRTVYLAKFISWRKKIRIAIEWTMNLFTPRDISEL